MVKLISKIEAKKIFKDEFSHDGYLACMACNQEASLFWFDGVGYNMLCKKHGNELGGENWV